MTKTELQEKLEGYNEVSGWITPNGDLVLSLTHSATPDDDALVLVTKDEQLRFVGGADWEEDEQLSRLNTGGNWNK